MIISINPEGIGKVVQDYVAEYEQRDPDYTPSEREQGLIQDAILGFLADMHLASDRELLEELVRRNEPSFSPNTIRLDPEKNQEFTVGVGKDHHATILLDWGESEEWPAWDEHS